MKETHLFRIPSPRLLLTFHLFLQYFADKLEVNTKLELHPLGDKLGLCSVNCSILAMIGNCSASLRVVSAMRGNPPLVKGYCLYCLVRFPTLISFQSEFIAHTLLLWTSCNVKFVYCGDFVQR